MKLRKIKKNKFIVSAIVILLLVSVVCFLLTPRYHNKPVLKGSDRPSDTFFTCSAENPENYYGIQSKIADMRLPWKLTVLNTEADKILINISNEHWSQLSDTAQSNMFTQVSRKLKEQYSSKLYVFYISCYESGINKELKYRWYGYTRQEGDSGGVTVKFGWNES